MYNQLMDLGFTLFAWTVLTIFFVATAFGSSRSWSLVVLVVRR